MLLSRHYIIAIVITLIIGIYQVEILLDNKILVKKIISILGKTELEIDKINVNFNNCFPASNINNIFELLIDIDYSNKIFSFNYNNENDESKLTKIINDNMNINKYSYSPCNNKDIISYFNYDNLKNYKNKIKCNWMQKYLLDYKNNIIIIKNNDLYYKNHNNYIKISNNECSNYTNLDTSSSIIIGYYIYNAISSIDLPIIKPIKYI